MTTEAMTKRIDPGAEGPNFILHVHLLWEPWRSDPAAVSQMVEDVQNLGFNAVNIEAKPWEEFFDYYRDGQACFYTDAVNRTLAACKERGLKHSWMGFWAYGENLDLLGISPLRIRQGETCHIPEHLKKGDILAGRNYKTWSPAVTRVLTEHHAGLSRSFKGESAQLLPDRKSDMVTGCEFSIRPSFDSDGVNRYRAWLARHYQHDIAAFNRSYGTSAQSFNEIAPEDYWFDYAGTHAPGKPWRHSHPDASEFLSAEVSLRRWVDNQHWRMEESESFARELKADYLTNAPDVGFWLWCNQWKQFFQDQGCAWWWHCDKGADPWRMRKHLDEVGFITSPSDCHHRSSAAALSAELAISRSVNRFEPFHAGLFLGQHMLGDVYSRVTPAEAIATCLMAGATRGLLAYGYNGLDDGGCLARMPWDFRESVRVGLDWFGKVQPHVKAAARKQTAILFPLATMMLEPVDTLEADRQPTAAQAHKLAKHPVIDPVVDFMGHRQDVLGWCHALRDAQYAVDFLHPSQASDGNLDAFNVLILPWCPAYRWMVDRDAEEAVVAWVKGGGTLLCGPDDTMLPEELRSPKKDHPIDIIDVDGPLIAEGVQISSFPELSPWAAYRSGETAIGVTSVGKGRVVRFGFHLGKAYEEPLLRHVAVGGHESFFPIHLLGKSLLGEVLRDLSLPPLWQGGSRPDWRDVEISRFESGWMVVNHSNHPWPWPEEWVDVIPMMAHPRNSGGLMPHDAAWVSL